MYAQHVGGYLESVYYNAYQFQLWHIITTFNIETDDCNQSSCLPNTRVLLNENIIIMCGCDVVD